MLKKLQERKLSLIGNMRSMLDNDSTFDDANYAKMETELSQIESQITRALKLEETERVMAETRDEAIISEPTTRADEAHNDKAKRYNDAFEQMLRMPIMNLKSEIRAVLNTGTGSEGGYLVPEAYLTTIIDKLLNMSVVRKVSNVIRTTSTTNIPLGGNRPSFTEIAENGQYGDTDASFGQVVLNAYKLGGIIKTSDELLRDSFVNVQAYLSKLIAEALDDIQETRFTTGTGTTMGTGFLVGGTLGKTTASATAVTLDEMVDLKYSLKAPYRAKANFMMNSSTESVLRKLKDTTGQYLWQPSLQVGAPNLFDGHPILINEKMPSIATGNKFAAFGDFNYFTIADRGSMEILRLNELYAGNGQVGWRVSQSYDCKVTQAEAIQYMKNA